MTPTECVVLTSIAWLFLFMFYFAHVSDTYYKPSKWIGENVYYFDTTMNREYYCAVDGVLISECDCRYCYNCSGYKHDYVLRPFRYIDHASRITYPATEECKERIGTTEITYRNFCMKSRYAHA